jgi:8-oxo-dGTP pyrophosphatase MutT (NUDIX family)
VDVLDTSGDAQPPIRMVREREVFGNRFVTVYDDDVLLPGDRAGRFLRIVEAGGCPGAAILASCRDQYALVQQYRYPLGSWEWAIPRGFAHGDDPRESALAELREEIGGEPDELTELGIVSSNSGLLAGRVHLFHARYAEAIADPADKDEVSAVRWVDLPALLAEIASGELIDSFTLSAITLAAARGELTLSAVGHLDPRPSAPPPVPPPL